VDYPEPTNVVDAEFIGIVESINVKQIKRSGDVMYSSTNDIVILSDSVRYSVLSDELSFNINDSVNVKVEPSDKNCLNCSNAKTTINKVGNDIYSTTYYKLDTLIKKATE